MTIIPDKRGNFRGRERTLGVLQITALWKLPETCGSSEGDRISCRNDNYRISAISINHIIIRCSISTGAVITISARAARSSLIPKSYRKFGNDANSTASSLQRNARAERDPELKASLEQLPRSASAP